MKWKRFLQPVLFTVGFAAAGLLYYKFYGCTTSCPISSSPVNTMVYMGVIGLLLSVAFRPSKA